MIRLLKSKSNDTHAAEIASPCIRNCCLDNAEICLGCFRSLAEILQWNKATELEKGEILKLCYARKEAKSIRFKGY